MANLKNQLIRLGSTNPELRKHIRPILDRVASHEQSLRRVDIAIANVKNTLQHLEEDPIDKVRHQRDLSSWISDAIQHLESIRKNYSRQGSRVASYDSFSKLKEFIEKDLNSPTLVKLLENYVVGDTPLQSDINYADPDIASLDRYLFNDTLTGPVAKIAEAFLEWLEDFRY